MVLRSLSKRNTWTAGNALWSLLKVSAVLLFLIERLPKLQAERWLKFQIYSLPLQPASWCSIAMKSWGLSLVFHSCCFHHLYPEFNLLQSLSDGACVLPTALTCSFSSTTTPTHSISSFLERKKLGERHTLVWAYGWYFGEMTDSQSKQAILQACRRGCIS